jgi:outer membrane protein TolC
MLPLNFRAAAWLLGVATAATLRAQDATAASLPPPANAAQASGAPASAAPAAPDADIQVSPFTLDQCVAQALAKNFQVQVQALSVDSAKAGVVIAKSAYDPTLGVTWQKAVTLSPAVTSSLSTAAGGAAPYSDNQSTAASITQPIITGGTITGNYDLARDYNNNLQTLLNPAYDGQVSLNVTQPLLQGAGADYGRASIEIARLGVSIANLNFKSAVLTTILNVETAYYNLIFARGQYRVDEDSLKLAQVLLDENTVKRQTGVLTDLDVVQAEAGVATAKSTLITAKQAVENAADTLLQAMGEREFTTAVGPVAFPALPDISNLSFYVSYKLARDQGPSLEIAQDTIDQLKLDALRAKRNYLPQLNVNGGAGYLSTEHSYSSASNNLWPGSGYNWNAGVSLSLPWGLRQNKALYRQAEDNLNAQKVTYDQTDQTLLVQVRADVRAVESNQENVAAAAEATRLSQKQYDLQKAEFDAGLATSYDVLNAQTLLSQARVTELQAQVNLRVALAELRFIEGSSLQNYHVNVN